MNEEHIAAIMKAVREQVSKDGISNPEEGLVTISLEKFRNFMELLHLAREAEKISRYGDGYIDTHTYRDLVSVLEKLEPK